MSGTYTHVQQALFFACDPTLVANQKKKNMDYNCRQDQVDGPSTFRIKDHLLTQAD